MKIILRQTVENLGRPGEVVNVKPGFANNFLIPQKMAFRFTEGNLKRVENEKKAIAAREAKVKEDALAIAEQFKDLAVTFEKKAGLEGVLYGSVTSSEITEALAAKGLEVDKRRLIIEDTIKRIGEFEVRIKLHPEVTITAKVFVKSEDGLAEKAIAEKAGSAAPETAEAEAADVAEAAAPEAAAEEAAVEETEEVAEETKEEVSE